MKSWKTRAHQTRMRQVQRQAIHGRRTRKVSWYAEAKVEAVGGGFSMDIGPEESLKESFPKKRGSVTRSQAMVAAAMASATEVFNAGNRCGGISDVLLLF